MTDTDHAILTSFDRLSTDDQREVAAEILRRTANLEYGSLDDEALNRLADELFVTLDKEEAANDKS